MTTFLNDLDKKSDDELIAISSGQIPSVMLSAKSTITAQDIIIQAKIILHNRQKKREKSTRRMTLCIVVFTIILTLLTAILVYFSFFDRPTPNLTNTPKLSQPKQLRPEYKATEPGNTEKKK